MADEIADWTPQTEWLFLARRFAEDFIGSKSAAWFFLGMATEAFDVAISTLLNLPYHPGIDFVVWAFAGMGMLYWQKKHQEIEYTGKEDDDDAALESED